MEENAYENPHMSRAEFDKIALESETFKRITERILSIAYGNMTKIPLNIDNAPGMSLLQAVVGISGHAEKPTYYHFSLILENGHAQSSSE